MCRLFILNCIQQETHKHIAGDLEERGDLKAAEEQYLKAGDWKSAVNMYRAAEEWNDAYRIAKQEGGDAAQKQVFTAVFSSISYKVIKFGMIKEFE